MIEANPQAGSTRRGKRGNETQAKASEDDKQDEAAAVRANIPLIYTLLNELID